MICEHLQQLYQLCLDQKIRLSGADLIHIFCHQCGRQEVCPSNLINDYDEESETDEKTGEEKSKNLSHQ